MGDPATPHVELNGLSHGGRLTRLPESNPGLSRLPLYYTPSDPRGGTAPGAGHGGGWIGAESVKVCHGGGGGGGGEVEDHGSAVRLTL